MKSTTTFYHINCLRPILLNKNCSQENEEEEEEEEDSIKAMMKTREKIHKKLSRKKEGKNKDIENTVTNESIFMV